MSLQEEFESYVTKSKTLSEKPANDVLLQIYSLFKQATEGDVQGERPGGFDFKGAAKFDAWTAQKGKTSETAMTEYIALVKSLS